jgi:hypothetical protein
MSSCITSSVCNALHSKLEAERANSSTQFVDDEEFPSLKVNSPTPTSDTALNTTPHRSPHHTKDPMSPGLNHSLVNVSRFHSIARVSHEFRLPARTCVIHAIKFGKSFPWIGLLSSGRVKWKFRFDRTFAYGVNAQPREGEGDKVQCPMS